MEVKRIFKSILLLFFACLLFEQSAHSAVKANLVEAGGEWNLENIGSSYGSVNLTSREWLGIKKEETCFRGFLGLTNGNCPKSSEFSSAMPSFGNIISAPFLWPVGAVIAPLSIVSGEFEDMFVLPIMVNQGYSESKFKTALAQAISKAGGEQEMASLLPECDRLLTEAASAVLPVNLKIPDAVQATNQIASDYIKDMEVVATSSMRLQVEDRSGFWSGGQVIPAGEYFDFKATVTTPAFAAPGYRSYVMVRDAVEKALFPATDFDDLSRRLGGARDTLTKAKAENATLKNFNEAEYQRAIAENEATLADFKAFLASRNGEVQISNPNRLSKKLQDDGYAIRLNLPQYVVIRGGTVSSGGEGALTIVSRTFMDVLPGNFSYSNADLDMRLDGYSLKVSNKTNTYISLDALSLYHKEDVLTLGGESLREIPPGSSVTINLGSFNLERLKTDYRGLTAEQAKKTTVEFGFACKYRRTDLTQARSFVEVKHYNLFDIISRQKLVASR